VCTIVGAFKVVCVYNCWCFQSGLYVQLLVLSKHQQLYIQTTPKTSLKMALYMSRNM